MQALQREFKNIPTDASLVCSSISCELNKEETLSAHSKVLICNNPEVNLHQQQTDGLKAVVFVLNINGEPLMPCSKTKARHLLEGGKAYVVKKFPFIIQLNFECDNQVQEVNLGIDSGAKFIGFSATSEKQELISGTLVLDLKTKDRLDEKRMYRKNRRSRLRYRKPRFNNRKRKADWLPPSIERKYQTHIFLIDKIKKILPIKNIIIEVAKFDIQKIMNSEINGKEYQQGNLYEYQNIVRVIFKRGKKIFVHIVRKNLKVNQKLYIIFIKEEIHEGQIE